MKAGASNRKSVRFSSARRSALYPSFGFAAPSELLERTLRNAVKAEQFAAALIPTRISRDVDRKRRVQDVVAKLASGEALSGDFAELVRAAADDVKAEEQRQLTESCYVAS